MTLQGYVDYIDILESTNEYYEYKRNIGELSLLETFMNSLINFDNFKDYNESVNEEDRIDFLINEDANIKEKIKVASNKIVEKSKSILNKAKEFLIKAWKALIAAINKFIKFIKANEHKVEITKLQKLSDEEIKEVKQREGYKKLEKKIGDLIIEVEYKESNCFEEEYFVDYLSEKSNLDEFNSVVNKVRNILRFEDGKNKKELNYITNELVSIMMGAADDRIPVNIHLDTIKMMKLLKDKNKSIFDILSSNNFVINNNSKNTITLKDLNEYSDILQYRLKEIQSAKDFDSNPNRGIKSLNDGKLLAYQKHAAQDVVRIINHQKKIDTYLQMVRLFEK